MTALAFAIKSNKKRLNHYFIAQLLLKFITLNFAPAKNEQSNSKSYRMFLPKPDYNPQKKIRKRDVFLFQDKSSSLISSA
jgi:hypothetical protein